MEEKTSPRPAPPDGISTPSPNLQDERVGDSLSPEAGDPRIEDYLDRACAPLLDKIPYGRRRELRFEWREHLDALIEARQVLGDDPERAVQEAIRQFGDPYRLGRNWAKAWERAYRNSLEGRREAMWRIPTALMVGTLLGPFASALSWWIICTLLGEPSFIVSLPGVTDTALMGFLFGPLIALPYGTLLQSASKGRGLARTGALVIGLALVYRYLCSLGADDPTAEYLTSYLCFMAMGIAGTYSLGLNLLKAIMQGIERFARAFLTATDRPIPG